MATVLIPRVPLTLILKQTTALRVAFITDTVIIPETNWKLDFLGKRREGKACMAAVLITSSRAAD